MRFGPKKDSERESDNMMASPPNKAIAKPPKKRKGIELTQAENLTPPVRMSTVDLRDWIGSSILAKHDDSTYEPGVIHSAPTENSVEIIFDRSTQPETYSNILESNDILGNHSPPAIMIKVGMTVCVRARHEDQIFRVGKIIEIKHGPPMSSLVHIRNEYLWVPRANLRLLQPPWYDDLEDTTAQEVRLVFFTDVIVLSRYHSPRVYQCR